MCNYPLERNRDSERERESRELAEKAGAGIFTTGLYALGNRHEYQYTELQQNFSGSNTDGSFTKAVSKSLEKNPIAADLVNLG